MDIKGNGLVI